MVALFLRFSFLVYLISCTSYAINTNPGGTGNGSDTSTDDWNGGQTYFWDFSVADNYVASGPTINNNFDQWTITNLSNASGGLTINIRNQSSDFSGTNGDDEQFQGYWFNDVVTVNGGDSFSASNITLSGGPGGGTWTPYVGGNKLSIRYSANYTAAPEPSTYIMVSGLLGLPLWRAFRRLRKPSVSEPLSSI
ncbi:MAG: hypothetical protein CMI26_11765 [Opitutae bacterium]|nr:hypothetical protein [Opitutae bacterium]